MCAILDDIDDAEWEEMGRGQARMTEAINRAYDEGRGIQEAIGVEQEDTLEEEERATLGSIGCEQVRLTLDANRACIEYKIIQEAIDGEREGEIGRIRDQ
jgi:hypothetical protein